MKNCRSARVALESLQEKRAIFLTKREAALKAWPNKMLREKIFMTADTSHKN